MCHAFMRLLIKAANLKLKTRPKQLLGSLLLDIEPPVIVQSDIWSAVAGANSLGCYTLGGLVFSRLGREVSSLFVNC